MTMRTSQGLVRVMVPLTSSSAEKYRDGYDRIFGKPAEAKECEHDWLRDHRHDEACCTKCKKVVFGWELISASK